MDLDRVRHTRGGLRAMVPSAAHPIVRALYAWVIANDLSMVEVARRAGASSSTYSRWAKGGGQSFADLQAALNVVGYDLVVRELGAPTLPAPLADAINTATEEPSP